MEIDFGALETRSDWPKQEVVINLDFYKVEISTTSCNPLSQPPPSSHFITTQDNEEIQQIHRDATLPT